MDIIIRNTGEVPIYDQITQQIKAHILSGGLREGEALPSIRTLARDLRISNVTVKRGYESLVKEGFLTNIPGKGFFVAARNLELVREDARRRVEELLAQAVETARSGGLSREEVGEMLELVCGEEPLPASDGAGAQAHRGGPEPSYRDELNAFLDSVYGGN